MSKMNRLHNLTNPHQGEHKKVLCVCSAGLLRSPTAAVVLSQEPFNHNTRAAGTSHDYALVVVDEFLLSWADEVVCMSGEQKAAILKLIARLELDSEHHPRIINLDIPDDFSYRDPVLMKLIAERYAFITAGAVNQELPK